MKHIVSGSIFEIKGRREAGGAVVIKVLFEGTRNRDRRVTSRIKEEHIDFNLHETHDRRQSGNIHTGLL